MKKDIWIRVITGVLALLLTFGGYLYIHKIVKTDTANTSKSKTAYANATVQKLIKDETTEDKDNENVLRGTQVISLKITSGEHAGEIHEVTNYLSALYNIDCQPDTNIVVRLDETSSGAIEVTVYNYDRKVLLIGAIVIFIAMLCIIGHKKGIMSIISLAYTLLNLLLILIPAIYYGASVLLTTILVIVLSNFVSFILIDGINRKTTAASLGTAAGVIIAGVFAFILGKMAHISGFQTNEAESLILTCKDYGMTVKNLFTAGILISALGAVMDVAMSIASSINEIHAVNPLLTARDLFRSGMNIGKDAMGTMSNTLILAFVGSSLNLVILIYSYDIPATQLWATDLVAREIIQGVSGSVGVVMTVPLVALISAMLFSRKGEVARRV